MMGELDVAQRGIYVQKAQANIVLGSLLCERDHALGRDVAREDHDVIVTAGRDVHQYGLERHREVGNKELVAGKDENNVVEVKRQLP